nr:reverse transcriptase domain-containing protein [Tanacetum cinerariifolium]
MAAEGNCDLPVPDLRTMKELCQPPLNGRGGPNASISIQATNFGLKNDMIQQSIKVNGVANDAFRLYLFPRSLTHHATDWFDRLPRNSINTFEQMAKMFLGKYFPPSMVTKLRNKITNFLQRPDESLFEACEGGTFMKRRPEECYDLIENLTAHHNDWDTSAQRIYQAPVHQPQIPQPQVVTTNEFTNFMKANDAIFKNMQTNITSLTNSNLELKNLFGQFMKMNTASSSGSRTLPGERETEETKDTVHPTNNESTKDVQPPVVQTESLILNSKPIVAPIIEPVVAPVSALKPNQRPLIPYSSRLHDRSSATKLMTNERNFFQIFKDLNFNISFADALILMPKFGLTSKTLSTNKYKLSELARTPLNEHYSAILLKKLPEKLGDPGKFLIPCDFPGMAECLALADLGASINLMPLSMWNKLSLPELTLTLMTLELADRSISRPNGVAKDVYVNVGKFNFLADFVVVDFDANPRVPLILERYFLKTRRDLINVFEGELTLCVGKEAITFNLDQTSRYLANYTDMTANRIDVIDMACEEYSQEVLSFSDAIASGNPTPYYDPIKLPEKLGDPGKFLIPCGFPRMAECLALADLDASINLMPLSMWNKLSLPELTLTLMTLELADRSISRPNGVAKDVYVNVGKFNFLADFVVVD